ncbi:uncharacterized protein METZ01_LOCUS263730 [marine metagenome]|uniref:GIY-YIG domain-containing protein n=1 Tax=marine metagenome TaxID=408172 RepID=A0A382JGA2_9ZZZZ
MIQGTRLYPESMVNIYVLKLERGKFYVGKTRHTVQRLRQHWDGQGAAWTRKYAMKDLYRWYPDKKSSDENRITLRMMAEHGVHNVRGGDWCSVKMGKKAIRELEKKCRTKKKAPVKKKASPRACKRCGRTSHTRSQCYAWTTVDGVDITTDSWVYRPKKKPKKSTRKAKARRKRCEARTEWGYGPRCTLTAKSGSKVCHIHARRR